LNCVDFLKLFREDPETKVIGAYLESFGSASGYDFFIELKKTTVKKPVIIWKGGYTEDGSRAAFSHTGAIASNNKLWKAMIKQTGAILVKDNEEWWNTLKTFELLYPKTMPQGRNIGIITPGGGSSVNLTDLFAINNLKVPELTMKSQEKMSEILPKENVNIKNPIDLGASGFLLDIFLRCINVLIKDPNIDIIVVPLWPHHLHAHVFNRMIKVQQAITKPFVFCLPNIADSFKVAKDFKGPQKILNEKRQLYFLSLRDAANSLSLLCDYVDFLNSHDIKILDL
jgi:acetyltransferase